MKFLVYEAIVRIEKRNVMKTLLVSLLLIVFIIAVYQDTFRNENGTKQRLQQDASKIQQQIEGLER